MEKRGVLEVGLVLLGLLFLAWTVIGLPTLAILMDAEPNETLRDPAFYARLQFLSSLTLGLMGLLLVVFPSAIAGFLGRRFSKEWTVSNVTAIEMLIGGVVLLGVYFFVKGVYGVTREIPAGVIQLLNPFTFFQFVAELLRLALGIMLAMRPRLVLRFISVNKSFKADA